MSDFQSFIDSTASKVRGAVSTAGVEHHARMRAFALMCSNASRDGWHDGNGGNLSYRLAPEDVTAAQNFFDDMPGVWHDLDVSVPGLAGEAFIVTGTGKYLRNVERDIANNVGIIEINPAGDAFRVVWGLKDGTQPTSELGCHLLVHESRKAASGGWDRVVYHAHTPNVVALTFALEPTSSEYSNVLWRCMPENIKAFPSGIGLVGWELPGSLDLAKATQDQMLRHDAVVWDKHGVIVAGPTFDAAYSLMHSIDRSAEIYRKVVTMTSKEQFLAGLTPEQLRAMASQFGVTLNDRYL